MIQETTATAPSPLASEQSISLNVHVEIMRDPDDGNATLCIATESNLGDFRETSPARSLAKLDEAQATIDAMRRLIREYEARDTLAAILAEHNAQLEEWDTDLADPKLRDGFMAAAMITREGITIVVPLGQDPIQRTAVVADLVNDLDAQAEQA